MATKRRKRYLENVGGYNIINSRYGSGDFYRPVVGPNLPELVVTPYGKVSYASTGGNFGTRFLTKDEWLNKNSKTTTSSSNTNTNFQKSSQEVQSRMKDAYEIINNARNQLMENNGPGYKIGGSVGRKRYAVGGSLSNRLNRRNYWFDENDGIVEYNNSVPEPTSNTTEEEPVVQQRTTPRRIQPNTTRTQNKPANKGIVTIGTKSFNSAFRQARIAGLDKFRWNGKIYGTKLANEVGKNIKEKARNAAKPVSQKPRNNNTNKTTRSNNRLNNPNDAVRTSYSRDNQGRIRGQLPTATVTAPARSRNNVNISLNNGNSPYSLQSLVSTPIDRNMVNNYNASVARRKQQFNRMADKNAAIGSQRWVEANRRRRGK